MKSIRDIDTSIEEGRILIVTLGRLSSLDKYAKKEPDIILREMSKLAKKIYK